MVRRIVLSCVSTAVLAATAGAADLSPAPESFGGSMDAPVPAVNWSGFYGGLTGGYGSGRSSADLYMNGTFLDRATFGRSGGSGGVEFGYNYIVAPDWLGRHRKRCLRGRDRRDRPRVHRTPGLHRHELQDRQGFHSSRAARIHRRQRAHLRYGRHSASRERRYQNDHLRRSRPSRGPRRTNLGFQRAGAWLDSGRRRRVGFFPGILRQG